MYLDGQHTSLKAKLYATYYHLWQIITLLPLLTKMESLIFLSTNGDENSDPLHTDHAGVSPRSNESEYETTTRDYRNRELSCQRSAGEGSK